MNGFFERYGRMIIVAVAICFVLLYLTPMRNVVGSSINCFAGNFANKVGDSIGAMKLPNGSANIVKEKSSMLITGEEFDNKIPSEATTVIFTDEKAPKGTPTTDLTVEKDGDVVGWLDGTTWKVSTQDYKKAVTFNKNSSKMFNGNNDLTTISFDNIDTSNVTNMICMFGHCSSLTSLNLSNFDTSKVTDMSEMLLSCYDLTSLDVTNFDTSNVVNMSKMFFRCYDLTSLNLSNFNTSNVTNMSKMFYGCHTLTSLDVTKFNTFNVTDMSGMFNNCFALTSLDITKLNTTNVTNMGNMFYGCRNLQEVDLSDLDTSNVTDMSSMFYHCYKLTKVKASQATYNNMNSLAEKNNKEVQDYIQLNPNKIEIVNK